MVRVDANGFHLSDDVAHGPDAREVFAVLSVTRSIARPTRRGSAHGGRDGWARQPNALHSRPLTTPGGDEGMGGGIVVFLPEGVWSAIVDLEPFPPHLALDATVRQRLRDAAPHTRATAIALRVLALTSEYADVLVERLNAVIGRRDAPRECWGAIELVREGLRLSSR